MAVRRKKVAEPEPVEVEEELEDLDDLEDIEEPEEDDDAEEVEEAPAPAKRGRKAAAPAKAAKATKKAAAPAKAATSEFDTTWLVGHVNDTLGTEHDGRSMRMVLRRMANNGDLARTVGEDRGRYEFPKGANDPSVKKIIAHIKAANATVPAKKAKAAAEPAPAKKAPAKKAATGRKRTRAAAE